jgi:asparagine synthase (glutamine-hydrolysing)
MLIWERGNEPTIRRWARPRPAHDLIEGDEQMLVEGLQARLRDSVKAHLVADVPVGVLLSGGIDSSLLTALASERVDRLQTFTIGFDERSFDERELARLVARRYSTDHHELLLRPDVTGLLPELVGVFDEPFADSSAIPTYLVSKLASSHVKVVLTGEGGDELFGGYFTYVADLLALRFGRAAATLEPLISLLPSSTAQASFDYRLKRFARGASLPPVDRHHSWRETFSARARADLLTPEWQTALDPLEFLRTRYAETKGAQPLARLQDLDVGGYLTDDLLVKTDRSSMANSLEARVPFLDRELASFAMALPDRHKVRRLQKKRLLRMAAAPLLPREIVEGRKRGFALPLATWLRGDLVPLVREALSPETVHRQGFFRPGVVSDLIERHTSGREDLSRQLWSLLTFSLWHERYVSGAVPSSTTSSARSSTPR